LGYLRRVRPSGGSDITRRIFDLWMACYTQ
jgi:hypothetical protein